jgi:hypothetical protein
VLHPSGEPARPLEGVALSPRGSTVTRVMEATAECSSWRRGRKMMLRLKKRLEGCVRRSVPNRGVGRGLQKPILEARTVSFDVTRTFNVELAIAVTWTILSMHRFSRTTYVFRSVVSTNFGYSNRKILETPNLRLSNTVPYITDGFTTEGSIVRIGFDRLKLTMAPGHAPDGVWATRRPVSGRT